MTRDQPRRRAWSSAGAVLVLGAVVALVVLPGGPSRTEDVRASTSVSMASVRDERVQAALTSLEVAWDTRDRAAFLAVARASPQSWAWAGEVFDALAAMDVDAIGMRYVDDRAPDTGSERLVPDEGATEFAADIAVTWQPGGEPDPAYWTTSATVPVRLADDGQHVRVLGLARAPAARRDRGPLPLWLAGELVVSGPPRTRCIGIDTDPEQIACGGLVRTAHRELAAVLSSDLRSRTGGLSIVLPATVEQAAALLGRSPVALTPIAGVTSTVDGSGAPGSPQLVVLNPARFGSLGPRHRQLVATHEAVHAVTGAAAAVMPVWVAEGFADYVALLPGRVPVEQAAAQVLQRVRRQGPPRSLPHDEDFGAARVRLVETYQQAWLAFRLLGQRFGADAVVAFYAAVLDGAPVGPALEGGFGITRAELTRAWRDVLVRLAG